MSIEEFAKLQAEMPTPELIEKARAWNTKLCETGGRAWSLRVPVSENDPDMIFGELCRRLEIATGFDKAFSLVNAATDLLKEMERMLVVIQRIEDELPATWAEATQGTGIATSNGYRVAINKAKGETP